MCQHSELDGSEQAQKAKIASFLASFSGPLFCLSELLLSRIRCNFESNRHLRVDDAATFPRCYMYHRSTVPVRDLTFKFSSLASRNVEELPFEGNIAIWGVRASRAMYMYRYIYTTVLECSGDLADTPTTHKIYRVKPSKTPHMRKALHLACERRDSTLCHKWPFVLDLSKHVGMRMLFRYTVSKLEVGPFSGKTSHLTE